jgi:flagellar hook assembly protein FlgD
MYGLPQESRVTVKVYSILGQEVRTLVDETQRASYYHVQWNGRNNSGMQVSSGVYFVRIVANALEGSNKTFTQVKKMVLMK